MSILSSLSLPNHSALSMVPQIDMQQKGPTFSRPKFNAIQNKLSDHEPFSATTSVKSGNLTLTTFNAWARGTRNGFMNTTGYETGRAEPNVEGRINSLIKHITDSLSQNPEQILGLQEWNINDADKLLKSLPASFAGFSAPTKGESFYNVMIYNKNRFKLVPNQTQLEPSLDKLGWIFSPNSGIQTGRYISAQFEEVTTGDKLHVVNLHLKAGASPQNIASALTAIQAQNLVVMGDFNADLTHQGVNGFSVGVNSNGTLTAGQNAPTIKTTDAIALRLDPNFGRNWGPLSKNTQLKLDTETDSDLHPSAIIHKHITNRLQVRVEAAFNAGLIKEDDLQKLGKTAFKDQEDFLMKDLKHADILTNNIKKSLQERVKSLIKEKRMNANDIISIAALDFKDQDAFINKNYPKTK